MLQMIELDFQNIDFEIKDNRVVIPEFLPSVKCKVLQHEIDFSEKAITKNDRLNEAENKITDIMIYLYQVYGNFHRLDKTEVEMAHEIWLDLKNVRSKIETLKNQK